MEITFAKTETQSSICQAILIGSLKKQQCSGGWDRTRLQDLLNHACGETTVVDELVMK